MRLCLKVGRQQGHLNLMLGPGAERFCRKILRKEEASVNSGNVLMRCSLTLPAGRCHFFH